MFWDIRKKPYNLDIWAKHMSYFDEFEFFGSFWVVLVNNQYKGKDLKVWNFAWMMP